MENSNHSDDNVRRIVLPSGRTIDVVYFESAKDDKDAKPAAESHSPVEMHVCPKCSSKLVYPTDWTDISDTHWKVSLRCPECEWRTVGVFAQADVDRFDEILDRGTDDLVDDLKVLVQANMEDDVDLFVRALSADAVWPMDF